MASQAFHRDTVEIVSPKDPNKKLTINQIKYDPSSHTLWSDKDAPPEKKRRGRPPKAKPFEGDNEPVSIPDTDQTVISPKETPSDSEEPEPIWESKTDG